MEANMSRYRNARTMVNILCASGVCLPSYVAPAYDRLVAYMNECEEVDMDTAEWNQSAYDTVWHFVNTSSLGL